MKYLVSMFPKDHCDACDKAHGVVNVDGQRVYVCDACRPWRCSTCLRQFRETTVDIERTSFPVCWDCANSTDIQEKVIANIQATWESGHGMQLFHEMLVSGEQVHNVVMKCLLNVYDPYTPLQELRGKSIYTIAKSHERHDVISMIQSYV